MFIRKNRVPSPQGLSPNGICHQQYRFNVTFSWKTWQTNSVNIWLCMHFFLLFGLIGVCVQRLCCGWNRCSICASSLVRTRVIPCALNIQPICQHYLSRAWPVVAKNLLLNLFNIQTSLGMVGGSKMFNCTFNALPVMVCKHFFPEWFCLKSVMQIFPVEMYKHLQTFKKFCFFQRLRDGLWPWNVWGKRILYWEVLLSWWALWSGRHCFPDCFNDKRWVLFSVLSL